LTPIKNWCKVQKEDVLTPSASPSHTLDLPLDTIFEI
jgi:hypothetical protein